MRGGQPSTTQPIAGPWLSPKVVTRNKCPKVLNDISNDPADSLVRQGLGLTLNWHGLGRGRFGSPRPTPGQMERRLCAAAWGTGVLRRDMPMAHKNLYQKFAP